MTPTDFNHKALSQCAIKGNYMMYNEKLAVAIKSNGKVLREFKDSVYMSFGSEYSITIKNLNSVRAMVSVFIDGTNMTPDSLVVNAGQQIDFERSLVNGNLNIGNKFKFIERTSSVENHRGIKLEDGLVRIEYQFEKIYQPSTFPYTTLGNVCSAESTYNNILRNSTTVSASAVNTMNATLTSNCAPDNARSVVAQQFQNETGITVPGSVSEQKFITVSNFSVEPTKHVIVLKLLGETPDNKPIAVESKPKCITCNHQNKAHAKFCINCGTSLNIYA